jgi:hypothetical protein
MISFARSMTNIVNQNQTRFLSDCYHRIRLRLDLVEKEGVRLLPFPVVQIPEGNCKFCCIVSLRRSYL